MARWNSLFLHFLEVLEKMKPFIIKQKASLWSPIPLGKQLAVTLGYLAAGESYKSLIYQFCIHKTTISEIIQVVYTVIYKVLQPIYIRFLSKISKHIHTIRIWWQNQQQWLHEREHIVLESCFGVTLPITNYQKRQLQ